MKINNRQLLIIFCVYTCLYVFISRSTKFNEIYTYERFLVIIIYNITCFAVLKKYWKSQRALTVFFIISIATIFIIILIYIRYQEVFPLIELPSKENFRPRIIYAIDLAIKYLIISILFFRYYLLNKQINRLKIETINIKQEELKYLALQANQHLIYNSLNMLYSKANNSSPYIGALIMNLSKQIRKII